MSDYNDTVNKVTVETPVCQPTQNKSNGLAIVALVLGILSLVLSTLIGVFLGVAAIIFACCAPKNKNGKRSGLATAGLICGIIGTVLSVIFLLFYAIFAILMGSVMVLPYFAIFPLLIFA